MTFIRSRWALAAAAAGLAGLIGFSAPAASASSHTAANHTAAGHTTAGPITAATTRPAVRVLGAVPLAAGPGSTACALRLVPLGHVARPFVRSTLPVPAGGRVAPRPSKLVRLAPKGSGVICATIAPAFTCAGHGVRGVGRLFLAPRLRVRALRLLPSGTVKLVRVRVAKGTLVHLPLPRLAPVACNATK